MIKIHTNINNIQLILENNIPDTLSDERLLQPSFVMRTTSAIARRLRPIIWIVLRNAYHLVRPLVRPLAHQGRDFLVSDLRADISRVMRSGDSEQILLIRRDQIAILKELQDIRATLKRLEKQAQSGGPRT